MQKTYSAKVEGMTCGNCALSISRLLEKKGAMNISANAGTGDVSFTAAEDANVVPMYDAIDSLGYHVIRENGSAENHLGHVHGSSRKQDWLLLICILLSAPLIFHVLHHKTWIQFALATPVYLIGCYVFLPSAYRSLLHRMPNMNVLIMLGASAAYLYSLTGLIFFYEQVHAYLFFDAAASIITLVMVGNWLEHRTVRSTTVAIDALVKLQPQFARIVMNDSLGKESVMNVETKFVQEGDVVLVNTGDAIPVDGVIMSGEAEMDEKMITGESLPVKKTIGEKLVGGTIVLNGNLRVKATTVGSASVLSHIIRMVREAQATKPNLQKLADKISAVFVPVVLLIAVLTLLINYFFAGQVFSESIMRSIAVLVIACPCAMGLATPAAIAVGLGRAARNGILIKGGATLEQLKTIKQIVFDKTGTITTGKLQIGSYQVSGMDEDAFKQIVTSIEQHSSHPIAKSVVDQWRTDKPFQFKEINELKGKGMEAIDEAGNTWQLGSAKWLHHDQVNRDYDLYLYENGNYKGALKIGDTLRPDAAATIQQLHHLGYKTILLSGDKKEKTESIAKQLGIKEVYAEQSPEQKNKKIDELTKQMPTAMVGDGINDAPALARATVGISLSDASQIAIQSASIILSNNQLSTLPKAIRLGIYTEQTIKQNLFWAFFYNIIAIPVAAVGLLTPTWGAAIMAFSDVVLVINSLRLGIRNIEKP